MQTDDLYFDIETTGFHRTYSQVFLIGLLYLEADRLVLHQYYVTDKAPESECALIEAVVPYLASRRIVTFNGDQFDLPYLASRAGHVGASFPSLESLHSHDIYNVVKRYKPFLPLSTTKLKDVEKLISIDRVDALSGAEVAKQFQSVIASDRSMDEILLHNEEDVIYTARLMEIEEVIEKRREISIDIPGTYRRALFPDALAMQGGEKNRLTSQTGTPPQVNLWIEDVRLDKDFAHLVLESPAPAFPLLVEDNAFSLHWDDRLQIRVPAIEAFDGDDDQEIALLLGLLPVGTTAENHSPHIVSPPFLPLRSKASIYRDNVGELVRAVLQAAFQKLDS